MKKVALGEGMSVTSEFGVVACIGRDRKTGCDSNESGQSRNEGENPHSLKVSGKDCKSLRECEAAESVRKSRRNTKGMREVSPIFRGKFPPARNIVLAVDPRLMYHNLRQCHRQKLREVSLGMTEHNIGNRRAGTPLARHDVSHVIVSARGTIFTLRREKSLA